MNLTIEVIHRLDPEAVKLLTLLFRPSMQLASYELPTVAPAVAAPVAAPVAAAAPAVTPVAAPVAAPAPTPTSKAMAKAKAEKSAADAEPVKVKPPTMEEMARLITSTMDKVGTNAVREVFSRHKVSRLVDLAKSNYTAFAADLNAVCDAFAAKGAAS